MYRGKLTDEQWEQLQPVLPAHKPSTGRPARSHREMLNAMLWIARTGAPWRDLSQRYGPWQTVASRFYRWRQAQVLGRVLVALQAQADAQGQLDWDRHFVGGSVIRAHQHAAGAKGASRGRGIRAQSGWIEHQTAPTHGRSGQAAVLSRHAGAAA